MAFETDRFLKAGFVARTADVKVPDLRDFFSEGEEPVWTVRGLEGNEVGRAKHAVEKYRNLTGLMSKILSGTAKEKVEAALDSLGYGDNTPDDIVLRQEYLIMASIEPKVDRELASRLCKFFPVEFFALTNEIYTLTGKGHMPGKQKASGETTASMQA